jgi:WD40 repeat protein/nucleoside phosphorylase
VGLHQFDALIITALLDELEAVLAFGEGGKAGWTKGKDPDGFPFHYRELPREGGAEPLRIAAASFDEMGGTMTATRATALIKHLDPECLAMCGICAGNKKDVALGDVIVADRVFRYDSGKVTARRGKSGKRSEEFFHDIKTYNLEDTWRVDAAYFAREAAAWTVELANDRPLSLEAQQRWFLRALYEHEKKGAVAPHEHPDREVCCPSFDVVWDRLRLPRNGLLVTAPGVPTLTEKGRAHATELAIKYPKALPKDRDFKIHVGPIVTGEALQKDPELFTRLERVGRKILGAEMEAAAVGLVGEHLGRHSIVVKAVSDYGDEDKDDAFRKFAARASAEVLLRFLLRKLEPAERPLDEDLEVEERDESPFSSPRIEMARGDDLLSRVKKIAELQARETGSTVEVRRFHTRPPFGEYLRVSKVRGSFTSVAPVAAVDTITADVLDAFLVAIDARYRKHDSGVLSTLVYGGTPPSNEVRAKAEARRVQLQSFTEYQGLIDFRGYLERQVARLEKDPIYPPELYIEQRAELLLEGGKFETSDALAEVEKLLASPLGRFVLMLGDFGTGKTFLLHELARRMALSALSGGPLVPVLIEMRALEKANKLDALISHHLAMAGIDRIDLPAFRYMLSEGRIALLFDGFDELALRVSYERAAEHFSTLIEAAQGEAKVVISSRTQHFYSDKQVKLALAEQASALKGYRLVRLQQFTHEQIHRCLVKRLKDPEQAERRFRLLDEVKDLLGLAHNPRMLGFISDIPEEELLKAKERHQTITSASLYELLLRRWLVHEYDRAHPKGGIPGLTVEQRWKAVTDLAMRLWQRTERTINILELPEELTAAVKALATHNLNPEEVKHQIGSGTLLVRDEEDSFSFIHQSVMEWLVAKAIAGDLQQTGVAVALGVREVSLLMADFVWGLAGREAAEQWAHDALASTGSEAIHKNALKILERLGVEARRGLKLARQDLSGQDFSGKDLQGADLTGANLMGTTLVGANLTGAKLVNAKLQRADLSKATLTRADLRGANMLGARLLGANAVGAQFAGASLREAKLSQARCDARALDECDLFGAALPEDSRAMPMVSGGTPCLGVAHSPDGRLLASSHWGTVRLWDLETGLEQRILHDHEGWVRGVVFSPDGKMLASWADDGTVSLWELGTRIERRVLKGHARSVLSVAFSADGKTLASGDRSGIVSLWEVGTGTQQHVFKGHAGRVLSVAFSADGKTLASWADDDAIVRLWGVGTGAQQHMLKGHARTVRSAAFSPDGKTLAFGDDDGTVRLWEVGTGAQQHVLKGHARTVRSVAFSSDGRMLASGASDGSVSLWEVGTRAQQRVLGFAGSVLSVAFSADGKTLASGADDGTVRLWEVGTGAERRVLKGHERSVLSVAFSPDGKTLASGDKDGSVSLWAVGTGVQQRVLKGHAGSVRSVTFSPDGRTLASGADDSTGRLWAVGTGVQEFVLRAHAWRANGVTFSPDGKALAFGTNDGTVRLWEVGTGAERRVLKGHAWSVLIVAFSADGKTLASGDRSGTVSLWEVGTGAQQDVLKGHAASVLSVAFSADGKTLASGDRSGTVSLWEVGTGVQQRILKGHAGSVRSVTFSPDGKMLASGADDGTVRLWEVGTGTEQRVLKGHKWSVNGVAFSPDGKTLASGADDGTVTLWSSATGESLAALVSLPEGWVAFTSDGRYRSMGNLGGAFWHAIGLCRFEPGELDPYLPAPLRVPEHEPLYQLPQ